jgi:hypothetical protein
MEVFMKFDPEIKQDKGRKFPVSLLGYKSGYIYTSISEEAFKNVMMFEKKVHFEDTVFSFSRYFTMKLIH